jgi:hypothetical protein
VTRLVSGLGRVESDSPSGPTETGEGRWQFTFKLEHPDGTPADPPTIRIAVPNGEIGDRIPMCPGKPALVVVGLRAVNDPEQHALLVVEKA